MNNYYEEIMNLKEAEDLKPFVKRLETLSGNIKTAPPRSEIILPNLLMVARSGVGKTNLLKLLSEYIDSKGNLMSFYGDVKFFEFSLGYCQPGETFKELLRLFDEVGFAAGFRNEFRGVIRIDIDEWINHFEEKHFIDFLEYLSANDEKWFIILSVTPTDKKKIHNLKAFLSMYMRIEEVSLSLPKTEELFDYIESTLSGYGLTLSEGGKKLLTETINKLRKNKNFDGFKSIKLLCQDIAYTFFSQEKIKDYIIDEEFLKFFAPESSYVKETELKYDKVQKIGLIQKEN